MAKTKKIKVKKNILPEVKMHDSSSLQINKNYTVVNLNGDVFINVDAVLKAIEDKTIFEYKCLTGNKNITLMGGPRYYMHSYLFAALNNMKKFSVEVKPGWYVTRWYNENFPKNIDKDFNRVVNSVFYDEFLFLMGESLIEADIIELSEEDPFVEFNKKLFAETQEDKTPDVIKPLYVCKTKQELRKAWAKLCMLYHPDLIDGDEKIIQLINIAYETLSKTLE